MKLLKLSLLNYIRWSLLPIYLLINQVAFGQYIHEVPLGGNAYITQNPAQNGAQIRPDGIRNWSSTETVISWWIHIDRPVKAELSLAATVHEGDSELSIKVADNHFNLKIQDNNSARNRLGSVEFTEPGYHRIDIRGIEKKGPAFATDLKLFMSIMDSLARVSFVKDNVDNRFYWGRRGPSVHLAYTMPQDQDIEWFYNEITVPEGEDQIGSYFMANGFGEGYFGIQVNSPEERRILFSVWSPFVTDNPKDIPDSLRIKLIGKGEKTIVNDFGNEGSGGQSRIIFSWKAGVTYSFLTRVAPDNQGNTLYTSWFYDPEEPKWHFVASFLRPATHTWLTRAHSFLENFVDTNGYKGRMAWYGNGRVRDREGNWYELTEARFTGDDIARREYRLDFAGGSDGKRFFLRNGGFFNEHVELNKVFHRNKQSNLPVGIPERMNSFQE